MKTITIILIALFLSVTIFFGVVIIKKSVNDKKISNLETDNIGQTISDTGVSEITQSGSSSSTDNSECFNCFGNSGNQRPDFRHSS